MRSMFDDKTYLMDGATGTELLKAGMPLGACQESWVLAHPQALLELQRRYVEAGSRLLHAPTEHLNQLHLGRYGFQGSLDAMARELVELSRSAAGGKALVLGSIGPTGLRPAPYGDGDEYEIMGAAAEQVRALEAADVDVFALGHQRYLSEARIFLEAIRMVSERPAIVSFHCDANGRTADGFELGDAASQLEGLSIAAFGIDCLGDLEANVRLLRKIREWTDLPLLVRPSAGLPRPEDGRSVYSLPPETLAAYVPAFAEAGAMLMGGCCGTGAEHVAALHAAIRAL